MRNIAFKQKELQKLPTNFVMIIIILKIELYFGLYFKDFYKIYTTQREGTIFSHAQLSLCSRRNFLKMDSLVNENLFVTRWKMRALIMTDN